METFTTKTGYGYFKNSQGKIHSKVECKPGGYELTPGFTFVEVADEAAMLAVEIDVLPPTEEEQIRQLKAEKMEEFAIAELIKEGKLKKVDGKIKLTS